MRQERRVAALGRNVALVVGVGAFAAGALGQYASGFEDLSVGVLTGQDGYYLPSGADFDVHGYAGNVLGMATNPTGGDQFVGMVGPGDGVYGRAQRDVSWGSGEWTIAYDVAGNFLGEPGTAGNNLGSVSLQPFPGSASLIALATWSTLEVSWQAGYVWYDAAGAQVNEPIADPAFQNLDLTHWYRWSSTLNFDTNQVVEVAITDLTTGVTTTNNPVDRYLEGGAAGGMPIPTGFRFFSGGGVAGNVLGFDNISIVPAPGAMSLLALGGLAAIRRRR